MGLSHNKIKYIKSLKEKRFRSKYKCFVAEGEKLVFDLMETCKCQMIAALPGILSLHKEIAAEEIIVASEVELDRATSLKTAPAVIAVFYQPQSDINLQSFNTSLNLILDGVQDPGNVGTIVRIADWFGINNIFCSFDCADVFNPKTVQATMGSIARVRVTYTDIFALITKSNNIPVYGTFLRGKNIYEESLSKNGLIVMGSEGKGISREIDKLVTDRLFIPYFPVDNKSSESLNVAVATAITCSEFRRRHF
ncbi:MAG: RNA methyltransferase [Fermentimonas sp.]|nr:RNA methyltransferase [Fermentimonas sp.]